MYKNSIPEVPELEQIAKFASFLDSIGEHEDAEVLDEYIEKAATYNEFEILKQAGLWGNIWKRLKGSVKKMFISEYRELYDEAKRSQDKLEERILKIKNESKNIKESFRNYDFGEWRVNIAKLQMQGLQTSDIMQGFEAKYAKFINYVTEHYKDDESELSSDFKAMSDKTKVNKKDEDALLKFFKGLDLKNRSWNESDGQNKSIQVYAHDTNIIRIEKSWYDSWESKGHIKTVSGEPDVMCMNTEKVLMKGKDGKEKERGRPENLKKALSNFKWKEIGLYEGFIYFKKDGQLSDKDQLVEENIVVKDADPSEIPSEITPITPPVAPPVASPVVPPVAKPEESSNVPSKTQPISGLGDKPQHSVKVPENKEDELEPLSKRDDLDKSTDVTQIIEKLEPSGEKTNVGGEVGKKSETPGVFTQLSNRDKESKKKSPKTLGTGNIASNKEVEEAERLSGKENFPITGRPKGTEWVRYIGKKGGRFAPILVNKIDSNKHELVTVPESISKLDRIWADRENEKRKKENEASQISTAILQRKDKIISISSQLDVSPRKQRILELSKK